MEIKEASNITRKLTKYGKEYSPILASDWEFYLNEKQYFRNLDYFF